MEIALQITQALLPILAAITAIIAPLLVKKLLDKFGLERSERLDKMIDDYVGKGVSAVERYADAYFKVNKTKMGSQNKKAKALAIVLDELKQAGVTDVAKELIAHRIEAYLEVREPGKLKD